MPKVLASECHWVILSNPRKTQRPYILSSAWKKCCNPQPGAQMTQVWWQWDRIEHQYNSSDNNDDKKKCWHLLSIYCVPGTGSVLSFLILSTTYRWLLPTICMISNLPEHSGLVNVGNKASFPDSVGTWPLRDAFWQSKEWSAPKHSGPLPLSPASLNTQLAQNPNTEHTLYTERRPREQQEGRLLQTKESSLRIKPNLLTPWSQTLASISVWRSKFL